MGSRLDLTNVLFLETQIMLFFILMLPVKECALPKVILISSEPYSMVRQQLQFIDTTYTSVEMTGYYWSHHKFAWSGRGN